ncbi:MAG: hypothetical protein ABI345_08085 [Jatrophihabitans sp.]
MSAVASDPPEASPDFNDGLGSGVVIDASSGLALGATPAARPRRQTGVAALALLGVYLAVFGPGIASSFRSVLGDATRVDTTWPARVAALEWDVFAVLIVVTVVLRWLPKHAPDVTARMALQRRLGRAVPGGIAGAAAGFVAIAMVSSRLGDQVATGLDLVHGGQPQAGTGLGSFLSSVSAAASAALTEELVLVALAVALVEQYAAERNERARWLVPGTLGLLLALRWLVHLYYLWGSVFVLFWVPGVYLLYRWVGSVWPLVLGHFGYDCAALAGHAFPSTTSAVDAGLWAVSGVGVVALAASVARRPLTRSGSGPRRRSS